MPSTYLEYLQLLTDVFAECVRTLEPGGRIAVNVANLGRKPYRSLSSDVVRILEHDLGLLLRGELIWHKAAGATGSCAWGSYRSAANPVLRDLTERVVVASKGRFDRARSIKRRQDEGRPFQSTLKADEFMARTLDVWSIPTESARRVGHPAPFPVELPDQLIRLYTYAGDLVLDPFMGSGSALVAADRLDRRYVGYDLDASYVELARRRVEADRAEPPANLLDDQAASDFAAHGEVDTTAAAKHLAEAALVETGFTIAGRDHRVRRSGVTTTFLAADATGSRWHVLVAGPNLSHQGGLRRREVVWETLGMAAAMRGVERDIPVLVLTTDLPQRPGVSDSALRAAGSQVVFDVVDMGSPDGRGRLARYAVAGSATGPRPGFWKSADLVRPAGHTPSAPPS